MLALNLIQISEKGPEDSRDTVVDLGSLTINPSRVNL